MTVFVSYSHDPEGRQIAERLVAALRERGVKAIWDADIKEGNPSSVQEWIVRGIVDHPVICVLSPDYVRRFGRGDDSPLRKGTLFEGRAVMRKVFDHTAPNGCPVIPVAVPGFTADLAPHVLKTLVISRYDPATDGGVDEIVARLRQLDVTTCSATSPRDRSVSKIDKVKDCALRDVMRRLEEAEPSLEEALSLVHQWRKLAAGEREHREDFAQAFPAVERIIKCAGDVDLMRVVVDQCLAALSGGRLLESDKRMRARLLICGRGWHLRRERELASALDAVVLGITVAKACGDQGLVALGKRCLGRVHRGLAEDIEGAVRDQHLRKALQYALEAKDMFATMDANSHEVAVCSIVIARIHFTKYRLLGQRKALRRAHKMADLGPVRLPPDRLRERHEFLILRAEIATARNRVCLARALLDKAIAGLSERADDGASYAELLGDAHMARAELSRKTRGRDITGDVKAAKEIFVRLELQHSIARCDWFLMRLERRSVGMSHRDVKTLKRLCADPRERLRAVQEHKTGSAKETEWRWWWSGTNWEVIVQRVRDTT